MPRTESGRRSPCRSSSRFWLKGEEDLGPAKTKQYARWRELRKLQQDQMGADPGATRP